MRAIVPQSEGYERDLIRDLARGLRPRLEPKAAHPPNPRRVLLGKKSRSGVSHYQFCESSAHSPAERPSLSRRTYRNYQTRQHWEGARVIDREDNRRIRWIKQAVWIRKSTPVMNRDEGGYKLSHKDYEIVSPECGELRILQYNSERHDSTSMIFGRHITAVEAKVKYKFRLRGGSVRHKSPTYICLETADSWI
ncbi:hypothetical protein Bbelb_038840 [Branchiostoma belcheri]|nr:hypothetical protein Bbelb_038840 [Branchiostoma belcheri]